MEGPFAFASSRIQRYARAFEIGWIRSVPLGTVDRSEPCNLPHLGHPLSISFTKSDPRNLFVTLQENSLHGGTRIMETRSRFSGSVQIGQREWRRGSRVEFEIFISILRKVCRVSGIVVRMGSSEDDVWDRMEMQIVSGGIKVNYHFLEYFPKFLRNRLHLLSVRTVALFG